MQSNRFGDSSRLKRRSSSIHLIGVLFLRNISTLNIYTDTDGFDRLTLQVILRKKCIIESHPGRKMAFIGLVI